MNEGRGIYFNPEIAALKCVEDIFLDPGDGWIRINDDPSTGLLEARELIMRRGLAEEVTDIYWLDLTATNWEQERRISRLILEFKRDSDRLRETASDKDTFIQRLMAALGSTLRLGAS